MKSPLSFVKNYKESYTISPLDSAEYAETNRFHAAIVSPILFVFGVGDIIAILIFHHSELNNYLIDLLYFSFFTIAGISAYIFSQFVKNCEKEKAYIKKSIPFYIVYYSSLFASLYNFFILGKPFNGFLTYVFICCIVLSFFSISPLLFLLGQILIFTPMIPTLYKNFASSGLADAVLVTVVMFCLALHKRSTEKKHVLMAKKQKYSLEAKTFGNFTLLYENKVVKFDRTKSAELLAYLIFKNGSSANTKELISILWGDSADSSRYGNNLRNLIVDIKHTLNELEIMNFFITEYNNFRINPEVVKCDYYDLLAGDKTIISKFTGEFMSQYSWAEETAAFLEMKVTK